MKNKILVFLTSKITCTCDKNIDFFFFKNNDIALSEGIMHVSHVLFKSAFHQNL